MLSTEAEIIIRERDVGKRDAMIEMLAEQDAKDLLKFCMEFLPHTGNK